MKTSVTQLHSHAHRHQSWMLQSLAQSVLALSVLALVTIVGCGESQEIESIDQPGPSQPASQPDAATSSAGGSKTTSPDEPTKTELTKISIKDGSGETVLEWKPKEDGAKLTDHDDQEIARFTLKDNKLKIKAPDDSVIGYVVWNEGRYRIESADQETSLWKYSEQSDGDWRLKTGEEKLVYEIKKRDYGFEIEDGMESSIARIKLKDGKSSLRDADDKTIYSTRDKIELSAFNCLGLNAIESIELRAGLMTALMLNR